MRNAIEVPYRFAEADSPTRVMDLDAWFQSSHLDEDWAIPCGRYPEYLPPPCDQPAAWIAWTNRCCPDRQPAVVLCDAHKDELLSGECGICAHCRATFVPTRTGFTLIEPLNRRPQ